MMAATMTHRSHRRRSLRHKLARLSLPEITGSRAFWAIALLIVLTFLLGGSSRYGVESLIALRPAASMIGAYGLLGLHRDQVHAHRWLLVFAAACVALVALQLVPLPARWFQALPGRDLIVTIGRAAGQGAMSRPMTIAPVETWNDLWSLTVPIATLILAIQLDGADQRKVLMVLLIVGAASALWALAQINGDPTGPLYFYDKAKFGGAIGFFANKNHQAVFLATLIPLLAALRKIWLRRLRDRKKVRALNGVLAVVLLAFVPLLLIANSRAGLLAGVAGALASAWAFRSLRHDQGRLRVVAGFAMVASIAALFAVAIFADRALAWQRFFELNPADDLRYKILPLVHEQIVAAWPWGYGVGAFQKVYVMHEPDTLLSDIIMNQVHNDWLDIPLSAGIFGVALALWALGAVAWLGARVLLSRQAGSAVDLGRAAAIGLVLLAMGSAMDYPLRTPAIQVEAVLFAVWLVNAARRAPLTTD
jgi:hypothetical protein